MHVGRSCVSERVRVFIGYQRLSCAQSAYTNARWPVWPAPPYTRQTHRPTPPGIRILRFTPTQHEGSQTHSNWAVLNSVLTFASTIYLHTFAFGRVCLRRRFWWRGFGARCHRTQTQHCVLSSRLYVCGQYAVYSGRRRRRGGRRCG